MFVRGEQYESYIGRWSRRIAPDFIAWLDVPAGARWLDLGCGTGALTAALLAKVEPSSVLGIDPSEAFVAHAKGLIEDPRASFEVGDAQSLPDAVRDIDAVVSGLVLNFIPDPLRAVAEMTRVLAPGGIAAAYVWDYAEGMQIMRCFWDVATVLDAGAAEFDEGRRTSVCSPEELRKLAGSALTDVEVTEFTVPALFESFDAYWQPFLGGQGAAGSYVARLDDAHRESLREALDSSLPRADDGSIHLSARAWAVKGRKAERHGATQ